jgi:hypothetical protein
MGDDLFTQADFTALSERVVELENHMQEILLERTALVERVAALERLATLGKKDRACPSNMVQLRTLQIYRFVQNRQSTFNNSIILNESKIPGLSEGIVTDTLTDLRKMGLIVCPNEKCWGKGAEYFPMRRSNAESIILDYYSKKSTIQGETQQ